MGRKKIIVQRIECDKERSSKYSKRKKGILKKADELAVLCDVDIAMLMFSPTGRPTLFHPHSRPLSKILERYSLIPLQDREERRAYTIKTVQKSLQKNDTILSENDLLLSERDEVLEKNDNKITELNNVKNSLAEKMSILRDWENPHGVDDLDRLKIMEKFIVKRLNEINGMKIDIQEDEYNSGVITNGK